MPIFFLTPGYRTGRRSQRHPWSSFILQFQKNPRTHVYIWSLGMSIAGFVYKSFYRGPRQSVWSRYSCPAEILDWGHLVANIWSDY